MSHVDDYYDFHIGGHDARLIKIAIKNDIYHTITVRANIAKTIDFSGGTRKVEAIRLSKCFKATRIIWPERTGAIRRLYIHNADTLTRLDLTELTSLEELSILDCRSLEEIIGLSDTIKEINIHNVKLKNLNLTPLLKLQKINVATNCSEINVDAGGLDQLQIAMVTTKKTMTDKTDHSTLNFKGCTSLHTLYIDTGENPVTLDASACAGLKEDAILTGRGSEVIGLQEKRVTKDPAVLLKLSQDYYGITRLSKPGIHDRETIIQESGSQIEVDRASGAKITLLGMPVDVHVENSQKDLSKELRAFLIDNTYLPTSTFPAIYYLPELPFVKLPQYGIPASRVVTNKNPAKTIAAWELNEEGLVPNILNIGEEALKFPVVINFLQRLDTRKTKTVIDHREHPLQPFNKVVVAGVDWYYFKNKFPYLANKIVRVPPAAFLARGAGGALGLTPEAIGIYQSMLQDASNFLAKSMLQDYKTLSHRNRNLQILKQAAELRKISQAYFNMLARMTGANNPGSYEEQINPNSGSLIKNKDFIPQRNVDYENKPYDEQTPVGGEAKHRTPPDDDQTSVDAKAGAATPQQPGESKGRSPDAGKLKNNDFTPQRNVDYKPYDGQTPVGGEARHRTPPDDGQTNIDAKAGAAPPPDMQGKKAPQEPFDTPPDMRGKKAPQEPFDGPPDAMQPGTAPQEPFSANTTAKGLKNVPPMQIEPVDQLLIDHAKRLADAIDRFITKLRDLPDQTLINEEALHQIKDQLLDVPRMKADPTSQILLGAIKKLADEAGRLSNRYPELDPQFLLDFGSSSPPDINQLDAAKLNAAPNQQLLFQAAKKLAEKLAKMTNNLDDFGDQMLIIAESANRHLAAVAPLTPNSNNQRILDQAKRVADAVKEMTKSPDGMPEQIHIEAASRHQETNPASELKLLEASRNLANALKKMTESACAISSEKSSASSHAAAVLVDAAILDLKKDQAKVSVYDAAQDLIVAIKLLAKACNEELSQEEKEKLVQDYSSEKKTMILKILVNARDQYIVDHGLLTPGLGQFGRVPGKEDVKGEILSRFIDALSNNEVLSEELTDKEMKKLMGSEKKPSELSYALLGIKEEMRECLTGVKRPHPAPKSSPTLKDEL